MTKTSQSGFGNIDHLIILNVTAFVVALLAPAGLIRVADGQMLKGVAILIVAGLLFCRVLFFALTVEYGQYGWIGVLRVLVGVPLSWVLILFLLFQAESCGHRRCRRFTRGRRLRGDTNTGQMTPAGFEGLRLLQARERFVAVASTWNRGQKLT